MSKIIEQARNEGRARQLPGALLTYDGDGHTAHQRSGCIDKAVDAHLIDLRLPPGTRCS